MKTPQDIYLEELHYYLTQNFTPDQYGRVVDIAYEWRFGEPPVDPWKGSDMEFSVFCAHIKGFLIDRKEGDIYVKRWYHYFKPVEMVNGLVEVISANDDQD